MQLTAARVAEPKGQRRTDRIKINASIVVDQLVSRINH